MISSRLTSQTLRQGFQTAKRLCKDARQCSSAAETASKTELQNDSTAKIENRDITEAQDGQVSLHLRFLYPEFLPDPNPLYRNATREKLERIDMLARRTKIGIPEFYVGSILAVTYSEPHAPGKTNRFVGICIDRTGCGLRASIILRNVVDNQGVEVLYNLYDPTIQKIDCLRIEKRLDKDLYYLRDAPLEYSTFPFDMEPEIIPDGQEVPVNPLKVPLNPRPWLRKYEQLDYKGISTDIWSLIYENRKKKAAIAAKPWEKYDLMKIYRETIPEEEQREIFADAKVDLDKIEHTKYKMKNTRTFIRPKKRA